MCGVTVVICWRLAYVGPCWPVIPMGCPGNNCQNRACAHSLASNGSMPKNFTCDRNALLSFCLHCPTIQEWRKVNAFASMAD